MAAFGSLTQEQKDAYYDYENRLRAWTTLQAHANNVGAGLELTWTGPMAAIMVALDDNSIVPKTTGLAGAVSLDSDADMAAIRGDVLAIQALYTAQAKARWTKAAGGGNLV